LTNIISKNKKIKKKNYVKKHRNNLQYFKKQNYKLKFLSKINKNNFFKKRKKNAKKKKKIGKLKKKKQIYTVVIYNTFYVRKQ
jgi:hypothetical protein